MGKQFPPKPVQAHCTDCQEHLAQKKRVPLRFFTFPLKSTRVLFKEIALWGKCKNTVICGIKSMSNNANVENVGSINNPPGCFYMYVWMHACVCVTVSMSRCYPSASLTLSLLLSPNHRVSRVLQHHKSNCPFSVSNSTISACPHQRHQSLLAKFRW